MTSSDAKVLLVLAASNLSHAEIRQFARQVTREGPSWITEQISLLRDGQWQSSSNSFTKLPRSGFDQERLEEFRSTIDKVQELLIAQAAISKNEAVKLLTSLIIDDMPQSAHDIPSYSKIAFEIWLARLCDVVSPSVVLHHASRIRNMKIHRSGSRSSWPLSQSDD